MRQGLQRMEGAGLGVLACVLALATIGLITAVSAAPPGEAWQSLARHGLFLVLGVSGFAAAYCMPVESTRRWVVPAMAVLFVVLCLMLTTSLGRTANHATRWIQLGPLSLQPSILFQCLWPVALASWVARDPLRLRDWRQIMKLGVLFSLLAMPVLLQPDLGSVIILVLVSGVTFFFAGTPLRFLFVLIPLLFLFVVVMAQFFPHVAARLTWWEQPSDQVVPGMHAMSQGGLTGLGPGNGLMKFGMIPESDTDFVLPIVAEEWGLIGTASIWLLFVGFTFLGFRTARDSQTRYGIILMASATVMISFQAAYNMAMVTGLVPVKGLPLPFVSRGGSSILALSLLLGVSLRACSAEGRRRPDAASLFAT